MELSASSAFARYIYGIGLELEQGNPRFFILFFFVINTFVTCCEQFKKGINFLGAVP